MRYFIAPQGTMQTPIEVDVDGVPPCLFCGEPVTSPSMGGPLVCGACDGERNHDGTRWTGAQALERYSHRRDKIAKYQGLMTDRRMRAVDGLLAKMSPFPWSSVEGILQTSSRQVDVGDPADAAFMVLARQVLPDLIVLYEQHRAVVGERNVLLWEVGELPEDDREAAGTPRGRLQRERQPPG